MGKFPKGLYLISSLETFVSFGYYGVLISLSLYMILSLSWSNNFTSTTYGLVSGLFFITPVLGGYLADKYFGNVRSIIFGVVLMIIGVFVLYYSATLYQPGIPIHNHPIFNLQEITFIIGLIFMIIGNGLFKPNNSSMIEGLYSSGETSIIEESFTLFYMIFNGGCIISIVIISLIDGQNPYAFKNGFLIAGFVMLVGLIIYLLLKNKYLRNSQGELFGIEPNKTHVNFNDKNLDFELLKKMGLQSENSEKNKKLKEIKKLSKKEKIKIIDGKLSSVEKDRIKAIMVVVIFIVFFFIIFGQFGASLVYFAKDHVCLNIGNFEIPPQSFLVFNPIFIVLLAPVFVKLWEYLSKRNINLSIFTKVSLALFVLAVGYFLMCIPGNIIDNGGEKVSLIWMIIIYLFITVSELLCVPNTQALVSKIAPKKFLSLLMGIWLFADGIACLFSGFLSTFYPTAETPTPYLFGIPIVGFVDFFLIFAVLALVTGAILLILNKKVSKWVHWDSNEI